LRIPFARVVHCDWSVNAAKRWTTYATWQGGIWTIGAPALVGDVTEFINSLFETEEPMLVGLDFVIGLPRKYGVQLDSTNFLEHLAKLRDTNNHEFWNVAHAPEEISLQRPFFPRVPYKTVKQADLASRLNLPSPKDLWRECEFKTPTRAAACPLFWTLGPNQVGKATIHGWQHILLPILSCGGLLWPFHGSLQELSGRNRPVFCETYPAEACSQLNLVIKNKREKRARQLATSSIDAWMQDCQVQLTPEAKEIRQDGFGDHSSAEDAFDSFVGALSMIAIIEGRQTEGPRKIYDDPWEGWILGLQSP
jgi:hypothetical protein